MSSKTLDKEEINTEKERKLTDKIKELEKGNNSLRQNLIDTLNDLKTSEKENELIFAEKLKLQRQLGDDTSLASLYMQGSEQNDLHIPASIQEDEPVLEETPKEQIIEADSQRGYSYEDEIKADNEFYKANSKLIENTDDMIHKYNNMITNNLEATKSITPPPTSGGYTSHMPSGVSNLHKIDEIDVEGDAKSEKSITEMFSKKPKPTVKPIEESKVSKLNKSYITTQSVDKEAEILSSPKQKQSDANMNKVIGIITDLENDLKQSLHKDQPKGFFERRNKNNKTVNQDLSK